MKNEELMYLVNDGFRLKEIVFANIEKIIKSLQVYWSYIVKMDVSSVLKRTDEIKLFLKEVM